MLCEMARTVDELAFVAPETPMMSPAFTIFWFAVAALRHRALYRALLDEHIFRRAVCITRSGGERVYTVEDLT